MFRDKNRLFCVGKQRKNPKKKVNFGIVTRTKADLRWLDFVCLIFTNIKGKLCCLEPGLQREEEFGLEVLEEQECCLGAMLLYLCPHMFVQSHGGSSRPWSGWLPAFWDGFGTAQAARLEERSGMDGAGGVRLFFPQHFWSVIIWSCWCSSNLALSVGLQETSAEMWIKYWGKILCTRVGLSFSLWFSSFLLCSFPMGITGKNFSSWKSGKTCPSPRDPWACCTYKRVAWCLPYWGYQVLNVGLFLWFHPARNNRQILFFKMFCGNPKNLFQAMIYCSTVNFGGV